MWKHKKRFQKNNVIRQLSLLDSDGVNLSTNELLEYQAKTSLISLSLRRVLSSQSSGTYLARNKGRGMEFDEVRHYQNGDDIRSIDWRVTARTGKTHTKLFREEIERPVLIATDLSSGMFFGSQLLYKSVQASHLAALVAWYGFKSSDRVGGLVFSEQQHIELKPASRRRGVLHYLNALVSTHDTSIRESSQMYSDYFEKSCARLRQLAKPGALVYLISDFYNLNEISIAHLSQLSKHCELICCHVSDPLELRLPDVNSKISVAVSDGLNRKELTLGDMKLSNEYQQKAQATQSDIQQRLQQINARLFHVCASKSLESQMKEGGLQWIL